MKWLFLFIPIFIIILLLSYVKLNIVYIFYNGKNKLNISTSYMFGLIRPEVFPNGDNKKQKKFDKDKDIKNETFSLEKYGDYKKIFAYLLDKIVIEKLNWRTKIGYEDPFYLSMFYGSIWWIKGFINSLILSKKEIDEINIQVLPNYNINLLETRFNCIIKIRMVYIINVWIRLLKIYKGGEKNDRTSYRRFNENHNE